MEHRTGHPVVEVWVHGEGPFQFVLDTCAGGHGRIDNRLAERLGLEDAGVVRMGDGTGVNEREGRLVRVEALTVGDAAFEGLTMLVRNEEDLGGKLARGILGYGLFEQLLLTLDYPESKLRLSNGNLSDEDPHTVPVFTTMGVPEIDIRIGSESMRAHVDSGNMGGLTLPGHYKDTLELAGELVSAGRGQTLLNDFEVLSAPLANPLVLGTHRLDKTKASFIEIFRSANLGYSVLSEFALSFDQRSGRASFVPRAKGH